MALTADLRTHEDFPVRGWELALYIVVTVIGIFGNGLVLAVLRRNKQMRESAFGVYIGSLAIADVAVCSLCIPVYITSTSAFEDHPDGMAGDIMCKLWTGYFALFYFAVISVYTLVAISLERYLAICHPLKAKIRSTPRRAKKIIIIIWIFSFVPNFALIAGLKSTDPLHASFGAHCTGIIFPKNEIIWKFFYVAVFVMQYVIPITCMVVCFLKIKKALHINKLKALTCETAHVQAGQLAMIETRRKTIRTVVVMIVSYFACWSLNQALYFCLNLGFGVAWNGALMQISVIFCFCSSCINPIIYVCRSQQFRDGFREILCPNARRRQDYISFIC